MDIKPRTSEQDVPSQSSFQQMLSVKWSSLKRRMSTDHSQPIVLPVHAFEEVEALPDDLEYIDGGDIVQKHEPHRMESSEFQGDQPAKHSLIVVKEEPTNTQTETSSTAAEETVNEQTDVQCTSITNSKDVNDTNSGLPPVAEDM